MEINHFASSPFPPHKCFMTPMALTCTISAMSAVGWKYVRVDDSMTSRLMIPASLRVERVGVAYVRCLGNPMAPRLTLISVSGYSSEASSSRGAGQGGCKDDGVRLRCKFECVPPQMTVDGTHRDVRGSLESRLRKPRGSVVAFEVIVPL